MGAVDEGLIREGRLRPLASADELRLEKRGAVGHAPARDPGLLLDLFLTALEG
jgi:hypothetical protein